MSKTSKAELKKELRKLGIKIYKNKAQASFVRKGDVKKVLAYDDDFEIEVSGKATYSVTYDTWDDESLEIGDTDDKGFESKDNKIEDFDDLERVVKDMLNLDHADWSQSPMYAADIAKGHVWYGGEHDKDIKTGDITNHAYHFKNLSDGEAQYIYDHVK